MTEERYDHARHCRIPANLLPSDIIKLAAYHNLKPLEYITKHCNLVSIHNHIARLRGLGIITPKPPLDLELYYIQIKAPRPCHYFTGKTCSLPLEVRPRQCTKMNREEEQEYEYEKAAFYYQMVKLISQTGSAEKALELYLASLGLV